MSTIVSPAEVLGLAGVAIDSRVRRATGTSRTAACSASPSACTATRERMASSTIAKGSARWCASSCVRCSCCASR